MERAKFNINDILEAAAAENDRQLLTEYREPAPAEPRSGPEEERAYAAPESPAGCETDELIGRYSQKAVAADKKTSTDSLRESLAGSMANDKEVFNYYRSLENRKRSRKVEELYNLINFATESDLKERSDLETENPALQFTESDGS